MSAPSARGTRDHRSTGTSCNTTQRHTARSERGTEYAPRDSSTRGGNAAAYTHCYLPSGPASLVGDRPEADGLHPGPSSNTVLTQPVQLRSDTLTVAEPAWDPTIYRWVPGVVREAFSLVASDDASKGELERELTGLWRDMPAKMSLAEWRDAVAAKHGTADGEDPILAYAVGKYGLKPSIWIEDEEAQSKSRTSAFSPFDDDDEPVVPNTEGGVCGHPEVARDNLPAKDDDTVKGLSNDTAPFDRTPRTADAETGGPRLWRWAAEGKVKREEPNILGANSDEPRRTSETWSRQTRPYRRFEVQGGIGGLSGGDAGLASAAPEEAQARGVGYSKWG
ncbi:hypothetical protein FOMPIDRAFT_91294 [Fomitopsis schrenkii]|uniref:Uncharacterized protein n=1 Tax=Fomitopsis schrenkii TaxID=2126942 RepID=S8EZ64_FOMSC|nr:hypothetical protein FOMPIDRAFT_91294 [Fomitopsis schrenkii]